MQGIVEAENGLRYLETILRYVFNTVDMTKDEVKDMVEKSISPEKGELIMTLAERLYQKGAYDEIIATIQLVLNLRFENQSKVLMALIRKIDNIDELRRIKAAVLKANNESELSALIEQ